MPEKRNILMGLVGDPAHTASQHDALRPLLKAFKEALESLAGSAYKAEHSYAAAPLGPGPDNAGLQAAIRGALKKQRVHVIVPIASAVTRAAKAVVDQDYSTDRIPIVFTVVSDPKGEGILDGKPRITGVSRDLIKTAPDAVDRFADMLGRPCHIYCCFRPGLHQAECAWREINARPPANVTLHREDIRGNECTDFVRAINQIPGRLDSQRTGIFMIPDDLVGRCAPDVIRAAHGRKIPTFFQQVEWVCPGKGAAGPPFAPGGYGVTPEWVGRETAGYVHPVIERPNPDAATRDPRYPRNDELQFRVNERVAKDLGLEIPPGATPCEPSPALQVAPGREGRKGPAKAARKPAKKKPAPKRKAARKGRTARRTAKARKAGAREKRIARGRPKKK